jgi:PAS domain S-box-containing protein
MQKGIREINSFRQRLGSALLRRGELEFRRLLEKLPAGAYTCNPNGLITYFNQQAVHLWGREPKLNDVSDRFCGSYRLRSINGTVIPHDQSWMALALKEQKEYNRREMVIERLNGDQIIVLVHANPIYDEVGKLEGAVNVLVDITDQKQAEEDLKQADIAQNQFLAVLAHELRNPLAPITNALEVLRLNPGWQSEAEFPLEVIDRQVRQMARLIDDLLDVARISANKLELRKEKIQLKSVIDSAIEISRPLLDGAGLELIVSVPDNPIFLDGDLTRLAQVISNLLNNAAKYTDRGGRVSLSAEPKGNKFTITVTDTGIGIPHNLLPRVFDMFIQADQAIQHSHGGLGIGLTLVKQLVEMHGGSVSAYSDGPGQGSTFEVCLPVLETVHTEESHTNRQSSRNNVKIAFRILVVEDNLLSAEMLSTMLQLHGSEVLTANNGIEGLKIAESFRPDVVLLDIGLPTLSGYDVARALRQHAWGHGLILIAITGWGEENEKLRCAEAGIDYHLVKPVHPSELLNLLTSLTQERNGRSVPGSGLTV